MKRSTTCITVQALALLIFSSAVLLAEETDLSQYSDAELIAMTMREYQARYHYIETKIRLPGGQPDFAPWAPPANCGSFTTPPYPSDDWYGYTIQVNPNEAIDLTSSIYSKFVHSPPSGEPCYRIFGSFVSRDWENLDGMPAWTEDYSLTPLKYTATEFPELRNEDNSNWVTVQSSNYRVILENLYSALTGKLIIFEIASRTTDHKYAGTYQAFSYIDCEDAKSTGFSPFVSGGTDVYVFESTWYIPTQWYAERYAIQGRLECDLSTHTGTAKSFISIMPQSGGWSNLEPDHLRATEAWQQWPSGEFSAGENIQLGVLGDFTPEYTSNCPYPAIERGWDLWLRSMLLWPVFEQDPKGTVVQEADPNVAIYKAPEDDGNGGEKHVVYSAPNDCGDFYSGETVDGIVTPVSNPGATMVKIESFDPHLAGLTIEGSSIGTDRWYCVANISTANPLDFSVQALHGSGAIKFKVIFWRQVGSTLYHSEATVELNIEPSSGSPCCQAQEEDEGEGPCQLLYVYAGMASESIECGDPPSSESFMLTEHDNGDIEVQLPGCEEPYILYTPAPGFLSGFTYDTVEDENEDLIEFVATEHGAGLQYHYTIPEGDSEFRLTSVSDCASPTPHTLVTFEYNENGQIVYQRDGDNPSTHYIRYVYNVTSGYLESLEAVTPEGSKTFTIYTDGNGRITRVSGGGGGGGGCTECQVSDLIYSFNSDGKIHQVKIETSPGVELVLYEYTYDSEGNFTGKLQGQAGNGVPIRTVTRRTEGAIEILDKYTHSDTSTTQVVREYVNSAGLITQRQTFANTGEDPDNPTGEVFTEIMDYQYDPTSHRLTRRTVIPPLGAPSGTGIRSEFDYDDDTGALLEERRYDTAGGAVTLRTLTYNNTAEHTRLATETDTRGAVTSYTYNGNSPLVQTKTMPQVTEGIAGTKQLRYEYTYDDQNRITQDLTKDCSDPENVVALLTTAYRYDDFGHVDKQTVTDNVANPQVTLTTRYLYDGFGQLKWTISPEGVVSGKTYDNGGRFASDLVLADPTDLAITGDVIDDSGINFSTLEVFSQTRYHYGTAHDVQSGNYVKDRLQYVKQVKEDGAVVFAQEDDPNVAWVVTEYKYDQYGRRTSVIADAGGAALETQYAYDRQGHLVKTTLPNGKWTETYRDGRGLVKMEIVGHDSMSQNDWLVTLFYYDARGNLKEKVAPDGTSTVYKYDDFDRLIMVRKAAGN